MTYSDWPLYTFSGDKAPGDANANGRARAHHAFNPSASAHELYPRGQRW